MDRIAIAATCHFMYQSYANTTEQPTISDMPFELLNSMT